MSDESDDLERKKVRFVELCERRQEEGWQLIRQISEITALRKDFEHHEGRLDKLEDLTEEMMKEGREERKSLKDQITALREKVDHQIEMFAPALDFIHKSTQFRSRLGNICIGIVFFTFLLYLIDLPPDEIARMFATLLVKLI